MHPPNQPSLTAASLRVIAIVGCDGSGKSTLVTRLHAHLRQQRPVAVVYLGQSSGKIADWIARQPLIGAAFARYLKRKAGEVHAQKKAAPGIFTAGIIYLLSRWRCHKFCRLLQLARRGVLVVTDRFPQTEIPGFHFDGPELASKPDGGWLVRKLATGEARLYQQMAAYVPLLLIRLNVDLETACARKPDHKPATLRKKIAVLPQLQFNGARILDLDGRERADAVFDAALHAIDAALAATNT